MELVAPRVTNVSEDLGSYSICKSLTDLAIRIPKVIIAVGALQDLPAYERKEDVPHTLHLSPWMNVLHV